MNRRFHGLNENLHRSYHVGPDSKQTVSRNCLSHTFWVTGVQLFRMLKMLVFVEFNFLTG
jgi:hypothetical protein